jgi:hypothetical protein
MSNVVDIKVWQDKRKEMLLDKLREKINKAISDFDSNRQLALMPGQRPPGKSIFQGGLIVSDPAESSKREISMYILDDEL